MYGFLTRRPVIYAKCNFMRGRFNRIIFEWSRYRKLPRRKRIVSKWSIGVGWWVGSLVDKGEGNGGGFLWDCWNDAGMLYEGLTTALRPGQ